MINKIQIEVLKQATNSISNCKLILRNISGEGINIGSPVNMCTMGNKVLAYRWCDLLYTGYPSQVTVTGMICRNLSHDDQASIWSLCHVG